LSPRAVSNARSATPASRERACARLQRLHPLEPRRFTSALAGRAPLSPELRSSLPHTHHALDDAREQAEIFARLFEWQRS